MNSKSIVRRTLPLIIALAVIIIVAVSCTLLSGDKANPKITNPDGIFMKAGDVKVTNEEMYTKLKSSYGYTAIVDMMDKYLLGKEKDSSNKPYYVSVDKLSEEYLEEIDTRIEKAMYPNGKTGDLEVDAETKKNYEDNMFMSQGLKTLDEIKDFYNLTIARENYTRDTIRKKYEESINDKDLDDTITENDIGNYYDSNYKNELWTIVIPYNSQKEATNALNQLDIEIKTFTKDGKTVTAWVHGGTEDQLTVEEIKQAFIDLYNNAYSFKAIGYPNTGNPTANAVVRNGVHYNVVEGKIVFITEVDEDIDTDVIQNDSNLFHYTMTELNAVNANLGNYVNNDLRSITNEAANLVQTYSVNPRTYSGAINSYFVLKIDHEEAQNESDVKEEIITKIIDSKVSAQQKTILGDLRNSYKDNGGFIIYDLDIENAYIGNYSSHPATKKSSDDIVLQVGDFKVTADELFKALSLKYAEIDTISFYSFEYLLYSDFNTIYEYKGRKEKGTILDQEAWNDILDLIDLEKDKLASGQYAESGYNASYSWKKFLKNYFGVNNEDELKLIFLYQEVSSEFAKKMAETNQKLWDEVYLPNMTETYDLYINATGMHLLIHLMDEEGKIVNPEDWSADQEVLAQELYDLVLNEVAAARPNAIKTLLQTTIVNEYNNAPKFVATIEQILDGQPVYDAVTRKWVDLDAADYKYSKFKTAGFEIKFEELTTTTGVMVEPFEVAVREIWDEAMDLDLSGEYIKAYDGYTEDYLVTEFGYHVYVNLTVNNRVLGTKDGKTVPVEVPTLAQVLLYEEDTNHGDLDAFIKRGITTYYTPIRRELTGQYYPQIQLNNQLLSDIDNVEYLTFAAENSKTNLEYVLDLYNNAYYGQLKYFKNPADNK